MIIIPMVGKSSRFFNEGYTVPKYKLPLAGRTVFDWVLKSFEKCIYDEHFVFVVRSDFETDNFVKSRVEASGIKIYDIIEIQEDTEGQAHTVQMGIERAGLIEKNEPLAIFNADSFLMDFSFPKLDELGNGMIEVFMGEGEHWSFVEPQNETQVLRTAEKERISNLCSNGLYFFDSPKTFQLGFSSMMRSGKSVRGEYYVAPLYNELISSGFDVRYRIQPASNCVFCGTPTEYEQLISSGWSGF